MEADAGDDEETLSPMNTTITSKDWRDSITAMRRAALGETTSFRSRMRTRPFVPRLMIAAAASNDDSMAA